MQIIFEKNDIFTFENGAGVVIGDNLAILVISTGEGIGYEIASGPIPEKAKPGQLENLDYAVKMAIEGALATNAIYDRARSARKNDMIQFPFEGENYVLPMSASYSNAIVLPDGRVLSVRAWIETLPPTPEGLALVGRVKGAMAQKA